MNTFKMFFATALLIPLLSGAEEKNTPTCNSNCAALMQRLEKLDCSTAIPEAAQFLSDGRNLVVNISRGSSQMRNEIAALTKGLKSRERTMLDCATKHRDKKDFRDAMSAFLRANLAVEHLSETPGIPRQTQEMLIRDYEQAMETVSTMSSKWKS